MIESGTDRSSPIERRLGAREGVTCALRPDLVVTDDWTTPSLSGPLQRLGTGASAVPIVFVHDHTHGPDWYEGEDRARVEANLRARDSAVERHGGTVVAGQGVQHHALPEAGLLRPGMLVIGNDSHVATLGAYGVIAIAAQPTTVAAAIHTGLVRVRVPAPLGVEVVGAMPNGTSARDAARLLLAQLRRARNEGMRVTGAALVFHGPGIAGLSLAERAVLANVAPEAAALTSLFPCDEALVRHYRSRGVAAVAHAAWAPVRSVRLDLTRLEPLVARPGDAGDATILDEVDPTRVDRVFIGTCAGGTYEEIVAFARALGPRAAVPTTVTPVTRGVADRLEREGVAAQLRAAGVDVQPPGCGPCFGFGPGRLGDGEVAVTTGNRNAIGRYGSSRAHVYLASGATAGAAARTGIIGRARDHGRDRARRATTTGAACGPRLVRPRGGNVLRLHGTVTTDDITPSSVPGIGTSNSSDPAVLRRLLFHHLDPELERVDLAGSVIVADHDWGMGSNRASSVRAPMLAGVRAVIARSVAPLYASGARDEGMVVLELDDDDFYVRATPDATVSVSVDGDEVELAGRRYRSTQVDAVDAAIVAAGGVLEYLRAGGDLLG